MKETELGSERVKKICDILRRETLEPAKEQAQQILLAARMEAQSLIDEAKKTIEKMHEDARLEIERQKNMFHSSLYQGYKQALESLRQTIEKEILNKQLDHILQAPLQSPEVISQLITAVIKGIEKEGIEATLSAYIPAAVSARAINELLGKTILERLKEKSVLLSPIRGGIELKLHEKHITIDVSDEALKELITQYIRKDFQEMFFRNT